MERKNLIPTQEHEIKARDEFAEDYDRWYVESKGHLFDWVEKEVVKRSLKLNRDDIVLDAGCGTGRLTIEIARHVKKVYAIDFSYKSIEVLNEKLKRENIRNVITRVADISEELFLDDKVTKIVSVQVIQHLPTKEKRQKALVNLYNLLKESGIIVVTAYHYNFLAKMRGFLKEGYFDNGIYYFRFTKEEIKSTLEEVGFRQVAIKTYIHFKGYKVLNAFWNRLTPIPLALGYLDILLSNFYLPFGKYLIGRGIKI